MSMYQSEALNLARHKNLSGLRCDQIRPLTSISGGNWSGNVTCKYDCGSSTSILGRLLTANMKVSCGIGNASNATVALNTASKTSTIGTFVGFNSAGNTPPHTITRNWPLTNFTNIATYLNGTKLDETDYPGRIKTLLDVVYGGHQHDCGSGDAVPVPLDKLQTTNSSLNNGVYSHPIELNQSDCDYQFATAGVIGDKTTSVLSFHLPGCIYEAEQPVVGSTSLQVQFNIDSLYRGYLLDDDQPTVAGQVVAYSDTLAQGTIGLSVTDFWLDIYTIQDDSMAGLSRELYFLTYMYNAQPFISSQFSYQVSLPDGCDKILIAFISNRAGGAVNSVTGATSSPTNFSICSIFESTFNPNYTINQLDLTVAGQSYPIVTYNMASTVTATSGIDGDSLQRAYQDFVLNSSVLCDRLGPSLSSLRMWERQKVFCWQLPMGSIEGPRTALVRVNAQGPAGSLSPVQDISVFTCAVAMRKLVMTMGTNLQTNLSGPFAVY